jgi:hypothetical protein
MNAPLDRHDESGQTSGETAMTTRTITAFFDGHVFRPEGPLDLRPDTRYQITIVAEVSRPKPKTVWDVLDRYTGTLEGPGDWSLEVDHYLRGSPKRNTEDT